jgi:CMP/dCMP kinase
VTGLVVAMDGPSGSGKSSASRGVARALGLRYLDTGAMYRAVTWWMLEQSVDLADPQAIAARALDPVLTMGTDPDAPAVAVGGIDAAGPIRTSEVTAAVSAVSAVPEVRRRLVAEQREIIGAGGIVVEGRDIGTTVLPDADLKIFLTASPEARAARRSAELTGKEAADLATTQAALIKRDAADSGRKASPLAKAADAVEVDTTELTLEQVIERVVTLVEERKRREP